jgi:Fe-S-cluster containining protein
MPLSEKDIKRIEKLGYKKDEFSIVVDGVRVLKNVNGHCFFLNGCKCSIYKYRPIGCRIYPVIYDVEKRRAVVHDFCPLSKEVSISTIKKVEKLLIRHIESIFGKL